MPGSRLTYEILRYAPGYSAIVQSSPNLYVYNSFIQKYLERIIISKVYVDNSLGCNTMGAITDILHAGTGKQAKDSSGDVFWFKTASEWFQDGVSLDEIGRHLEAITSYEYTLKLNPKYAKAWNNKGSSLDDLGRYEEALACYRKAIEIDPKYFNAWYNKGIGEMNLGRFEEAVKSFNRVIAIDDRSAAAYFNKGVSLGKLGDFDGAVHAYEKALERDKNMAAAWYVKAITELRLGNTKAASESFKRFLPLSSPKDKELKEKAALLLRVMSNS
jgi:tetratricopeptide (TPR) repeat protein